MVLPLLFSIKYINGQYYIKAVGNGCIYKTYIFFLLFFCLFDKTSGDYFHYQEIVENIYSSRDYSTHLEFIYVWIIRLVGGNYFLFRLLIWGTAILLYYKMIDRLKLDKLLSIWSFIIISLVNFSYPRVSLGLIILFLGCTYLLNKSILNKILGILLVVFSIFFHKTIYLILPILILSFFSLKKWMIICLIILLPVMSFILNHLILLLIPYMSVTEFNYLNIEKESLGIAAIINKVLFYIPLSYILIDSVKSIYKIESRECLYFLRLSIYILLFSILLFALPFGSNYIFERIGLMALIPISIVFAYKLQYEKKSFMTILVLILLIMSNFYNLFYMYYLKKIGLGI
jgi:hypothetical protein